MAVQQLDQIFDPQRIALIGVTQNPNSVGGKVLGNLIGGGFRGVVYPVNPGAEAVLGISCYPDIKSLPKVPDLAVICTPADQVPEWIGICFDTSHAFAAGYDLRTEKSVEKTVRKIDEIIGFNKLKLVHLNDSKGDLNSRIDRHEHIGMGKIGEEGFRNVLGSKLGQLPLILETPVDARRNDVDNLRKVRDLAVGL